VNQQFPAALLAAGLTCGGALLAACGLGRPPSPAADAGAPPVLDGGSDAGARGTSAASTPLPSADELTRLAEETIRGGHASRVHDGHAPFEAALDLPDGGCGRVAFVAEQPVVAVTGDATGPRGDAVDAGAHVLSLVPPAGPVCGAVEGVTFRVSGSGSVRWTTVTR
jgi:hypothetical protein